MLKKQKLVIGLALIMTMVVIIFNPTSALADVLPDISASTVRIASLYDRVPSSSNNEYTATGGISVTSSGTNKRLFVVKANNTNDGASLFMYENYTNMQNNNNQGEFGTFVLNGFAGHANAMAIDDNYIYIVCWGDDSENSAKKVARISRSTLWNLYNNTSNTYKGTLNISSNGVKIFTAIGTNGIFISRIAAITKYNENGKFIVSYLPTVKKSDGFQHYFYTTATISGNNFVLSGLETDKFEVKVDFDGADIVGQDITYDPNCGFFIANWLEGAKNSIVWLRLDSLSGSNRVYNENNSRFRIIKINKSSSTFSKYELESVSIGSNKVMYASVNTASSVAEYNKDAVITIKRPTSAGGSYNFLGQYIEN